MTALRRSRNAQTVSRTGAEAGSILAGIGPSNGGLRLRVTRSQVRGSDGPIAGEFQILDAGENPHAEALRPLLRNLTDAGEVLQAIRRACPQRVSPVNANVLIVEHLGS